VAEFADLTDLKAHLNMASTRDDGELLDMLDAADEVVRGLVGSFAASSVVERVAVFDGTALLSRKPSGAVDLGDVTGFTVNAAAGLLQEVPAPNGARLTATYGTGGEPVPAAVRLATVIIAAHLWETQRGTASPSPLSPDDVAPGFGAGFAIPNRAKELLAPYTRPVQVA
jgi:hypothetical protein